MVNGSRCEKSGRGYPGEFNISLYTHLTDYIFSGESSDHMLTMIPPNPKNIYGESKLEGGRMAHERIISSRLLNNY